jgi:hypothetical protein
VLLYEWSKNFSKRKEKSSLPSLGYFRLNGEEKLENGVLIILLSRGVQKNRVTEKTEKTDEKLTEKTEPR